MTPLAAYPTTGGIVGQVRHSDQEEGSGLNPKRKIVKLPRVVDVPKPEQKPEKKTRKQERLARDSKQAKATFEMTQVEQRRQKRGGKKGFHKGGDAV